MIKLHGDVAIGEHKDLITFVRRQGKETVYICPYCIELGHKPDKEGKFYYDEVKQVGHCFRCEAVIVDNSLRSPELIRQQLDQESPEELYTHQELCIDNWTTPIDENTQSYNYMTRNRNISPETLKIFDIRACTVPKSGVVFCNRIWHRGRMTLTDFLIIRNVSSSIKHTIIKEMVKPLLWIDRIKSKDIVIVEGTISGLSTYQLTDGLSPVVLLGKTISELQLRQLQETCSNQKVDRVYIMCDGGFFENTLKIAREVYKKLVKQEVWVVKLPWGKDPNELTKQEFIANWTSSSRWLYEPMQENIIRHAAYNWKIGKTYVSAKQRV